MAREYAYEPQGIVKIYRFIPLDNTYQHTLHFKNVAAQYAYFHINPETTGGVLKFDFHGQTMTRNERKVIRLDHGYADLMDCNYLAFLNKPFATPNPLTNDGLWVYAFITNVAYVSPNVTEVEFEIDVMQTFMWNYELRECYVLREHSLTDNVGEHLLPEPVGANCISVPTKIEKTPWFDDYDVTFFTTFAVDGQGTNNPPPVSLLTGLPMVLDRKTFDIEDRTALQNWFDTYTVQQLSDGIITGVVIPHEFNVQDGNLITQSVQKVFDVTRPTTVSGIAVKNKKLLTYPYTSLIVDCGNNSAEYKYEFFKDVVRFYLRSNIGFNPQIVAYPYKYEYVSEDFEINVNANLTMENFPQIGFSGNYFAQWEAQNGAKVGSQAIMGMGETVAGTAAAIGATSALAVGETTVAAGALTLGASTVATGGIALAAAGIATAIAAVATIWGASKVPNPVRGSATVMNEVANKTRNFYFYCMQPIPEITYLLDDFFTMYGYTTNRVKIPNIVNYDTCRPHWNYIQATNLSFHWETYSQFDKGTSIPHIYMDKIISIYANGITFWKNANEVGRYNTYDNSPQ